MSARNVEVVIGLLDTPDELIHAAETVRDAGWRLWDCHTPYPVHGLEKAMGLKDSFIPWLTISAGLFGAVFAKMMQWFMSAKDYPLIIGGKPLFSWPAFIPVTFELFVLLGALTTFAAVLITCGLLKWRSPLHCAGVMQEVTGSRFAVVLDGTDKCFESEEAARALLSRCGCTDIHTVLDTTERVA